MERWVLFNGWHEIEDASMKARFLVRFSNGFLYGAKEFCAKHLDLKPGMKVLDVGCGIGGSAFHMASTYGASVRGIDLSTNMITIAIEYQAKQPDNVKHNASFLSSVRWKQIDEWPVFVLGARGVRMTVESNQGCWNELFLAAAGVFRDRRHHQGRIRGRVVRRHLQPRHAAPHRRQGGPLRQFLCEWRVPVSFFDGAATPQSGVVTHQWRGAETERRRRFVDSSAQKWLKPGGRVLISDYCRGDQDHSDAFLQYVAQRGYHLLTVEDYGNVLRRAGFHQVTEAQRATEKSTWIDRRESNKN